MVLIVPQRGHLMTRDRYSPSPSFLRQLPQRISLLFCISVLHGDSLAPLCAQHGASAKRRLALRAVAVAGVPPPVTVAPSLVAYQVIASTSSIVAALASCAFSSWACAKFAAPVATIEA